MFNVVSLVMPMTSTLWPTCAFRQPPMRSNDGLFSKETSCREPAFPAVPAVDVIAAEDGVCEALMTRFTATRDTADHLDPDAAEPSAFVCGWAFSRAQRATDSRGACVQRRDRLGGLLHECTVAT